MAVATGDPVRPNRAVVAPSRQGERSGHYHFASPTMIATKATGDIDEQIIINPWEGRYATRLLRSSAAFVLHRCCGERRMGASREAAFWRIAGDRAAALWRSP